MNALSVAVLFVALVASASASGILGHGIAGLGGGAILAGPSGTVIRSGIAAGPAVIAPGGIIAGHGILGAGIIGGGILGHGGAILGVPAGSGLEGQYIPDINEQLYDDGSYKPHIYGH